MDEKIIILDETLKTAKATTTICTTVSAAPSKLFRMSSGPQSRHSRHSHQAPSAKSVEGELDLEICLEEFDEEDRHQK